MRIQSNPISWLVICGLLAFIQPSQAKTTTLELISGLSLDTTGDSDGDQLSDGIERTLLGTLPDLLDTDGDGESDFQETLISSNPLSEIIRPPSDIKSLELVAEFHFDTTEDGDEDGLSDGFERVVFGLNPSLADTDGDLVTDFLETLRETNPFRGPASSATIALELITEFQLDTTGDTDQDRISNGLERALLGLDPLLADSDGDGESDFAEILRGLNSLSPQNATPITTTLELLAALTLDTTQDRDEDGLTDGIESNLIFTSATLADTDLDGVSDFREILLQENPFFKTQLIVARTLELLARLQLDTTVDRDQDGLSDGVEMHITFTDFQLIDTDGDGTPDDVEVLLGTNPYFQVSPPNDLRPVIQVNGITNDTMILTIDAAGARLIVLEATEDFIDWQQIATISVDANDPNPPSLAIPTDTDHAFFRIITRE